MTHNFVAVRTGMDLLQIILAPIHLNMDQIALICSFLAAKVDDGLVGIGDEHNSFVMDRSLPDASLGYLQCLTTARSGGPIKQIHPWRLMDPEGFLMALGRFFLSKGLAEA